MTVTNMQSEKIANLLMQVSLFKDLDQKSVHDVAAHVTDMHAQRGDIISKRGEACTGFDAIVYGRVKLSFSSAQGSEKVLELAGPGQTFGEAMMFVDKPHLLTAQALEDTMLLHVPTFAVREAIDKHPRFARRMLEGLSRRLHVLMGDVEAFSLNSGTQRVIDFLTGEAENESAEIVLPTSKTVVASRLNLTPEHFSRILHDLVGKHLIFVRGRAISIPNVAKLRACLH